MSGGAIPRDVQVIALVHNLSSAVSGSLIGESEEFMRLAGYVYGNTAQVARPGTTAHVLIVLAASPPAR